MGCQIIGKVGEVSNGVFRLAQMPEVEWPIREEDHDRIEEGDGICIELPNGPFPFVSPSQITEKDRQEYRIVRINKGGDPAFQG